MGMFPADTYILPQIRANVKPVRARQRTGAWYRDKVGNGMDRFTFTGTSLSVTL
jgi:hypothetical protein